MSSKTGEPRPTLPTPEGARPDGVSVAAEAPLARAVDEAIEASRRQPLWPTDGPFVALCVDAHHPTLQGRIKVRWGGRAALGGHDGSDDADWWVPTLHGQSFRPGDRLLLQKPVGAAEPVVLGVIDGFLPRPEPTRATGAELELRRDETLQVRTEDGQALVEIVRDDTGPIVRLLQADTRLQLRGKLSITAAALELKAERGEVRIEASDDVRVLGETIHLN